MAAEFPPPREKMRVEKPQAELDQLVAYAGTSKSCWEQVALQIGGVVSKWASVQIPPPDDLEEPTEQTLPPNNFF
jgi:hypothetical protein